MSQNACEISVVAPVYNEEEGIRFFCDRVTAVLEHEKLDYEIILVDDGSRDHSFENMKAFAEQNKRVRVIRFARNFGHQLALTAGLRAARGRAVMVMDSDLQDPPEIIPAFVKKWSEGYEIVHGVRKERRGESWFKKTTAFIFYRLLRACTNIDIPQDAGDFYLLDAKVVDILNKMEERHRFLRGLLAWVGFRHASVDYIREPRQKGITKYSLWKMMTFSLDAATSFSFTPLRAISSLGFFISFLSFLGIIAILFVKLFTNYTVTGWSSLMVTVLFIGGIQLIAIGIIGEYLARIGDDVKGRPLYIIKETVE